MVRVCVYQYDMGAFRRSYIQNVTLSELEEIQKSEFRRVVILPEGDWYGANAPSVFVDRQE